MDGRCYDNFYRDIVLPILSVCPIPVLSQRSKGMDIFDILVRAAPPPLQNSKRNPLAGLLNTKGCEFFLQISPFISETVRDRANGL